MPPISPEEHRRLSILMRKLKGELVKPEKPSRIGTLIGLSIVLIVFFAIWMLLTGCAPQKRVILIEESIQDPHAHGCYCGDLELEHFLLIGDAKLMRMTKMLEECRARRLVEDALE
jgi:hypothetical protein